MLKYLIQQQGPQLKVLTIINEYKRTRKRNKRKNNSA